MRGITSEALIALIPKVRDRAALETEFQGRDREAIAGDLIRRAVRSSGRVGIGGGMLASAEFLAPQSWFGIPAQVAAEAVAVALVEIKLTAELHNLYGLVDGTSVKEHGALWVTAWAKGSAVTVHSSRDLITAVTKLGQTQVKRRLARRARQNLTSLFPMMTGAAIARWANRRQTKKFARAMHASIKQAANA